MPLLEKLANSLTVHPHGPSATVQVLFTLNATALLYYYLRACRTDPGVVKATEEEKKMVKAAYNFEHLQHTLHYHYGSKIH